MGTLLNTYTLSEVINAVLNNGTKWSLTGLGKMSYTTFINTANKMGYVPLDDDLSLWATNGAKVTTAEQIGTDAVINNSSFAETLLNEANSTAGVEGGVMTADNLAPVFTDFEVTGTGTSAEITGATPVAASASLAGTIAAGACAVCGGILLGIDLYKSNPIFWTKASQWIGSKTPWKWDNIPVAYVKTLTDKKTYLPENFCQEFFNYLNSEKGFNFTNTIIVPSTAENWAYGSGKYTYPVYYKLPATEIYQLENEIYFYPYYYYYSGNKTYYAGYEAISKNPFHIRNYQGNGTLSSDYKLTIIYSGDTPPSTPQNYSYLWGSDAIEASYAGEYFYKYGASILTASTTDFSQYMTGNYHNSEGTNQIYADIIYNGVKKSSSGIDGITTTSDNNLYDGTSISTKYPEWFSNKLSIKNPLGNVTNFLPVSLPEQNPDTAGNTGTQADGQTGITPDTQYPSDDDLLDKLKKWIITIAPNFPVNPSPATPSTPTPIVPSGKSKSMWSIYNPSQTNIDSLGAWLWSAKFVDQLIKMFNSPSEAIISLHKVFVTPTQGENVNIKVGYLDSGVSSPTVAQQYETFDCGTISLKEYFGNCEDYARFTAVQLYLPFIGFVKLNTNDVMAGTINITYKTDNYTGAFLAIITVTKNGGGIALYQYGGNMGVHYPLSSGSFSSVITSLITTGAGIAGTIATGGALAPVAMGGAMSLLNSRASVNVSGGFNACTGAMGAKTPYLIITRPVVNNANYYPTYYGRPQNLTISLGSCIGLTRVKHLFSNINTATATEKQQIINLLKDGVIL